MAPTWGCHKAAALWCSASGTVPPALRLHVTDHPAVSPMPQVRAGMSAPASAASELRAAREEVEELIRKTSSNPILIRLGWHDAGTFDKVRAWMRLPFQNDGQGENGFGPGTCKIRGVKCLSSSAEALPWAPGSRVYSAVACGQPVGSAPPHLTKKG